MAIVLPEQYSATVTAKKQLTPKMWWVASQSTVPLPYIAGQYGSLLLDGQRRPLSFATPPEATKIEFLVDVSPNGVCSNFIKDVQPGAIYELLAPYGRFTLPEAISRPMLFVATGSGIAPVRAQIQQALALGTTQNLILLFGNKNEEFAFLDEEFTALSTQHPNFKFLPILSEPTPSWTGRQGLVTEAMTQVVEDIAQWDIYVCGNPTMVKDVRAIAEQLGVPKEQVHFEQF